MRLILLFIIKNGNMRVVRKFVGREFFIITLLDRLEFAAKWQENRGMGRRVLPEICLFKRVDLQICREINDNTFFSYHNSADRLPDSENFANNF